MDSTSRRRAGAIGVAASLAIVLSLAPSVTRPAPASAATAGLTRIHTWDDHIGNFTKRGGLDESFSAPTIGDITGDAIPEIIVGGMDGDIVARRPDGSEVWRKNFDGWGLQATPLIHDLSGDGRNDVLIGLMGGKVVWLDGPTGNIQRTFNNEASGICLPHEGEFCKLPGVFGTPTVADITGDGVEDIIATNWDSQVYAWRKDGSVIFRKYVLDTVWSSAVVADIDRDGSNEVVFGGTISYNGQQGGYLYILRGDGSHYPGYPRYLPGQSIWSTPALVDLDKDRDLDMVFGTGGDFPGPSGHRVYAYEARTFTPLPGWPVGTPGNVDGGPSIGDIDNDGQNEVVVGSEGGYVSAYNANGSVLWQRCNAYADAACQPYYSTHGTAVIADVDNDGQQEVVSAMEKHMRVYSGATGALEYEDSLQAWQAPDVWAPTSAATVAQVNGRTWIAQNAIIDTYDDNLRGSGDTFRTWVWQSSTALGRADWPTMKHDAKRSGRVVAGTETWAPFKAPNLFVAQLYRDFLNREADPSGQAYWTQLLQRGNTSGANLAEAFLTSDEFTRVVGPVVRLPFGLGNTPGTNFDLTLRRIDEVRGGRSLVSVANELVAVAPYSTMSNTDYVTTLYYNVYRRNPTTQERSADLYRLQSGTGRGQLLVDHLASPAGALLATNEVRVTMTYLGMMRRMPEPGGFGYWVARLDEGVSIRDLSSLFQFSLEYAERHRY